MSFEDRKKTIIDLLADTGGASMNKLCQKLYFSRSTLRRDLIQLEEEGIVRRYHGGVTLAAPSAIESSNAIRSMENSEKKASIARFCRQFLHDDMVVFMDSSSTVNMICPYIRTLQNITVITNGINNALDLNISKTTKVYMCPGILKTQSVSIIGEYTSEFLHQFKADLAMISCKAIKPEGIFEGDDGQAFVKRTMLSNSNKRILLCDSTKSNKEGYFKLTDFSALNTLITDDLLPQKITDNIKKQHCNILIAK